MVYESDELRCYYNGIIAWRLKQETVGGATVFVVEEEHQWLTAAGTLLARIDAEGGGHFSIRAGAQSSFGTNTNNSTYKFRFLNDINNDFARMVLFETKTTGTNAIASPMTFKLTSTGNMADGHGPGFLMAIEDNAGTENFIACMAAIRNGADNTGLWRLTLWNAGSPVDVLDVTSALMTIKTVDTIWTGDGSGLAYGNFYGNEIGFTSAVNNSYAIVADTDCSAGELNLITYTDAGTTLTVTKAGRYLCNWYMAVESNTANKHCVGGLMVDSTTVLQDAGKNHLEHTSANRQLTMSGTAILDLAANAVVGVGIGSEDNITVTVDHVGLTMTMVGGT